MTKLTISKDLALPLNSVTQKFGILGTTGSGKTYFATGLAEEMYYAGAQIVVLDPVGVWYGLRLNKDGKTPSDIAIPIFGGLHGDVPIDPSSGALIANLIVDKGISCIIDVSQMESDADKARFAQAFAEKFFYRKKAAPSAVHLFIEECQEFVPQNPQREENRMLHAFTRLQKLGRNFGIGTSLITQRPQEVNKKALNMAQTCFVFRITGSQERDAVEKWMKDKDLDQDLVNDLPKIETGMCHVWSPEFLKISRMVKIKEKRTFNASATPEVGAQAKQRKLASIDLEQIKADVQASIDKAKEEDPKHLKAQIEDLKKQLAAKIPADVGTLKVKEKNVLDKTLVKRIEDAIVKANVNSTKFITDINGLFVGFGNSSKSVLDAIQKAHQAAKEFESLPVFKPVEVKAKTIQGKGFNLTPGMLEATGLGKTVVGKCERAILTALAMYPAGRSKRQIALLTGYSIKSSSFANSLSLLRTNRMIDGTGDNIKITATGSVVLGDFEPLPTGVDLFTYWHNKLGKCEAEILFVLFNVSSTITLSKEEIASKTQSRYSPTSSSFANSLSYLRGLELIEGTGSSIKLSSDLKD